MKTTTIESVLSRRRLRRPVCFAMLWMGLAVAGMAQAPSAPPGEARIPGPDPGPVIAPSLPQCPSQEILAGVADGFSPNGVEIAAPSVALQTAVGGVVVGNPFADFDGTTLNRRLAVVGHNACDL